MRPRLVPVLCLAAGPFLAACVAPAPEAGPRIEAAPDPSVQPVAVPVAYAESETTGPRFNRLGGEIPRTVPTPEIEEGGLGEVPSG